MNSQSHLSVQDLQAFSVDPHSMAYRDKEEMLTLSPDDLETIQLGALRTRLAELLPKLTRLSALAEENRLTDIKDINEIVPLLFPHTECKSYPMSLIENCRFEQLNDWLNEFTIFDLSQLDVSICNSIDEWLDVVEANTQVRLITSSGTTGKISIISRSTVEEKLYIDCFRFLFRPFREEPGLEDVFAKNVYHVFPFSRYGRHITNFTIRTMVNHGFDGDDGNLLTLGTSVSTDVLWMAGRLRKAIADGSVEQLKKSKGWQRLETRLEAYNSSKETSLLDFFKTVLVEFKDKTVVICMGLNYFLTMLETADKSGLDMRFAPDSILTAAGGLKGVTMTPEQIREVKTKIPQGLQDFYACSEIMSGFAQKCAQGHYHPPPWQVIFVLDPDTGIPYPRAGVRTGRYAGFDLWARTYWGGFITGDEVTVNWDGECACGRTGPYFQGKISRYSEKRGGDDKITCQRTAGAVQEMMDHLKAQQVQS